MNIALESLKKNWPEIPVEKLEEHADKCRNESQYFNFYLLLLPVFFQVETV